MMMIMNKAIIYSMTALVAVSYGGSLSGSQKISTHDYQQVAPYLDTNPVSCGVLGSHMDINRITAVQGLDSSQCGTCLRIASTSSGKEVFVMAVDRGGLGLDLNGSSFQHLFGETTGVFDATWAPCDPGNCAGIITGGDYSLPGFRSSSSSSLQKVANNDSTSSPGSASPPSSSSPSCNTSRCADTAQLMVCAGGTSFPVACPAGTQCKTVNNMDACV